MHPMLSTSRLARVRVNITHTRSEPTKLQRMALCRPCEQTAKSAGESAETAVDHAHAKSVILRHLVGS